MKGMKGMRGHSHRRGFAALAVLVWLLGVEVLPNLHLATHNHDHTHEPDGTIVRVTFGDTHRHDDGSVHQHDDAAPDERRRAHDQLAFDDAGPAGHAASGLAHHALALHQPPPLMLAPVAVPRVEVWDEVALVDQLTTTLTARPAARGPPALSV